MFESYKERYFQHGTSVLNLGSDKNDEKSKPGVMVRCYGIVKADVVISGNDDNFLVGARRKHGLEATSDVTKLVIVAPLAFVEHVAEKKYHLRSAKNEGKMLKISTIHLKRKPRYDTIKYTRYCWV